MYTVSSERGKCKKLGKYLPRYVYIILRYQLLYS